jgi:hypothetical protein
MKADYKNRYGDVFTFTLLENGNILWEGKFEHCRFGWPNVYKDAYQQYRKDGGQTNIDEFKREVHDGSFDDNERWIPSQINKKYGPLVYSDTKSINMVDHQEALTLVLIWIWNVLARNLKAGLLDHLFVLKLAI